MTNSETGDRTGQNTTLIALRSSRIARIVRIVTFFKNHSESPESPLSDGIATFFNFQWRRAGVREVFDPREDRTNSETGVFPGPGLPRIPMKAAGKPRFRQKVTKSGIMIAKVRNRARSRTRSQTARNRTFLPGIVTFSHFSRSFPGKVGHFLAAFWPLFPIPRLLHA